MSRLVESIRLEDGVFANLRYHEQRMAHSLRMLFGHAGAVTLEAYLRQLRYPGKGLFKCRVVYDDRSRAVEFVPYQPRTVRRIKVVEDDRIAYAHKFVDRRHIDRLFAQRGDCDDVLIVKEGMATDCSFSNIVFRKGDDWFTPRSCLLDGTMRRRLVDENVVRVREIPVSDVRSYDTFKIINAMLEFDSPEIEVSHIVF